MAAGAIDIDMQELFTASSLMTELEDILRDFLLKRLALSNFATP